MEELINFIIKDGSLLTIAILILIATTIFDFFSYSTKNTNIRDKETIKKIKRTSMYVKITIMYILTKIFIWLLIFSVNILFYHTNNEFMIFITFLLVFLITTFEYPLLYFIFWRCPHCHKRLDTYREYKGIISPKLTDTCPYCKEKIIKE